MYFRNVLGKIISFKLDKSLSDVKSMRDSMYDLFVGDAHLFSYFEKN